jgi:hypothetical protein
LGTQGGSCGCPKQDAAVIRKFGLWKIRFMGKSGLWIIYPDRLFYIRININPIWQEITCENCRIGFSIKFSKSFVFLPVLFGFTYSDLRRKTVITLSKRQIVSVLPSGAKKRLPFFPGTGPCRQCFPPSEVVISAIPCEIHSERI